MKIGYPNEEATIPIPKYGNFAIEPQEISRITRLASGKMVKDLIAIKRKYTLNYDGLKTSDIQLFSDYYEAGQPVNFIYDDAGETKTASVYIMDYPRDVFVQAPQFSKNIQVVLEEV